MTLGGMEIARKLSEAQDSPKGRTASVVVNGITFPLFKERSGNWRIRKRSKVVSIDVGLGVSLLTEAKVKARHIVGTETARNYRLRSGGASLREFCDAYLEMPRDCRDYVAEQNIVYFKMIMRTVLKKEKDKEWGLKDARVGGLSSDVWSDFMKIRQGGKLDYALPKEGNAGINSAVRSALSIFAKPLEREYEKRGFKLDWNELRRVKWLPTLDVPKTKEPAELAPAIRKLREEDPRKWRAVGLARFAGLRQNEIQHARREWLERDENKITSILIMHRPTEGFYAKSNKPRYALILDQQLADDLWDTPAGRLLAPHPENCGQEKFFDRDCNTWVRKFVPTGKGAMHRLRGYYADEVAKLTEDATRARLAGIRAAQEQLGHKDDKTTIAHYLSTDHAHP